MQDNKIMNLFDTSRKQAWTIRILEKQKNDEYGAKIEFYDADYDFDKDESGRILGQFVSSYYIETLLSDEYGGAIGKGRGLNLMGHEPKWSISGEGMDLVADFVKEYLKHNQ